MASPTFADDDVEKGVSVKDTKSNNDTESEPGVVVESFNGGDAFSLYNQQKKNLHTPDVLPPPVCCYKRRVGNFFVCLDRKKADGMTDLLCMVGPCWPMMFVTLGLIIGIAGLVDIFVIPEIENKTVRYVVLALAIFGLLVTVSSYLATACSNPGIQPIVKEKPGEDWTWNGNAESWRRHGVNYEYQSGTLIKNVDHFCPWTGTVIAQNNMKRFITFNISVCGLLCYTVAICIGVFIIP
mmetsp:Transcript_9533/g.11873  ORF Transcript_9533/g.11873 Transcript_9533/m.11873 type:complete len:239 (-) Transcript_9533:1669-2385(-)